MVLALLSSSPSSWSRRSWCWSLVGRSGRTVPGSPRRRRVVSSVRASCRGGRLRHLSARRALVLRWAAWPGVALLGVAAECLAFGAFDVRAATPDLLSGWGMLGAGLYVAVRRPGHPAGLLLGAAGGAWFAGTVFEPLLFLHRGPLLHLLLTFPDARARTIWGRAGIVACYVAAVIPPVWDDALSTTVAAVVIEVILFRRYAAAAGPVRRARRVA